MEFRWGRGSYLASVIFPLLEHVYGITDLSSPSRKWDAQRGLRRTRSDPTAALPRCAPYRASKANRACEWSVCVVGLHAPFQRDNAGCRSWLRRPVPGCRSLSPLDPTRPLRRCPLGPGHRPSANSRRRSPVSRIPPLWVLVRGVVTAARIHSRNIDRSGAIFHNSSEDSKGARWPTAKRGTSEGWSDPPIWSPWNFQFPNPNRKRQGHARLTRIC
jgi:hypothetical protein